MADRILALIGVRGHAAGEIFVLEPGRSYCIGRSRSCDISFRRLPAWIDKTEEEQNVDMHFRTISGKHLTLAVSADAREVTVTDHSSNGTFLDSRRMECPITLTDLDDREHYLRFGSQEEMVLKCRSDDEA